MSAQNFYRSLLRLFPFDFRREFESEMEQTFQEQHEEVKRRGDRIGLLRLWWDTLAGIVTTAPAEHVSMLRQDVRYAFRMMRKNLGYTIVAATTLALGIGANTAIVSVINTVLLKPLPYEHGNELVMLDHRSERTGLSAGFSVPEVNDYRAQSRTFTGLVEYHNMNFTLLSGNEATEVRTGVVSDGFFRVLGVRPILGRDFTPDDDKPGAPAVLMLSYEYWKQHENYDPNIVGKRYELNDRVHTVIGVLPPVPQYPDENDVYMPTSACPFRANPKTIANRGIRMMSVFGRLKPGVTLGQAKADLTVIDSRLTREYPQAYPKDKALASVPLSLREELTHRARPMLLVLLGAAACVLLIACANVANLTLARMSGRERELVVRSALGAGKSRLLRQLFTESLILGLIAAGFGMVFAWQTLSLLVDFVARLTPRAREIHVDGYMLLFALAAALFTAIVSGSVSALYSRDELSTGLKEGGSLQLSSGRRRTLARDVLVCCQVAFSLVMLVGAGLMLRSFDKMRRVDPGFVPQRVMAMNISLNWSKHNGMDGVREISKRILEKVEVQPGVLSAAIASGYPLEPEGISMGPWNRSMMIEGRPQRDGEKPPRAALRITTPAYFKTLGIPLIKGRTFQDSDNEKALDVAVINRTMARHNWPNEDPLGRRVSFDGGEHWITIVGVVGDVKEFGLNRDPNEEMYLAQAQSPGMLHCVLVRTSQDGMGIVNTMRRAVLAVDPQTAIPNVETLEQARHESMASPRVMTDLLGIFGGLALVIAAFGIGGILALAVNQRLNEIGIRIALGARWSHILVLVVGKGMLLVTIGLGIGLAAALALTGMMKTLLFQVGPTDPATFAGVSMVLATTALLACYIPARRALRIDPLSALRSE